MKHVLIVSNKVGDVELVYPYSKKTLAKLLKMYWFKDLNPDGLAEWKEWIETGNYDTACVIRAPFHSLTYADVFESSQA